MKRLLLYFTFLMCGFSFYAQPTFFGTSLENGTYTTYNLTDLGAFRQAQLTASTGAPISTRTWEFATGNYFENWRPYTAPNTLSGYNITIDPASQAASARYNNNFGGQTALLPVVQAGSYYTVNVTEFATIAEPGVPGQYMAILESNWCHTCRPITAVSGTGCLDECGYEVSVTLVFAPAANEYVYVRYSTDGFATSSLAEVNFTGPFGPLQPIIGTATIPGQGAGVGVDYYVYSSNRTLAQIQAEVASHGQVAHDMMTVNLNNNGGSNYSVAACTNYAAVTAACQSTVVNLDASGNGVLLAADVDGGSTDACDAVTLAVSPNSFTCADVGSNQVTLTATDGNSNQATCTATVTVNDITLPVANCQAVTVDLDASGEKNYGYSLGPVAGTLTDWVAPTASSTATDCDCPPGHIVVGYQGRVGQALDEFFLLCH